MLVEIQALLAPRRAAARAPVVGWDSGRLSMLLAVLKSRCGLGFGTRTSTSTSPAACASPNPPPTSPWPRRWSPPRRTGRPPDAVFFGEVGLSGEVRQVAQAESRLREAQKLGFAAAARRRAGAAKALSPFTRLRILGSFMDKCFGTIGR